MDDKYRYICSVDCGLQLIAAAMENHEASPGDLVYLASGKTGHVVKVVLMNTEYEDYQLFADFVPIDEVVEVFRHVWSKTDEMQKEDM